MSDSLYSLFELIASNIYPIALSVIAIVVVFFLYKFLSRQITRLRERRRLEENIAFTLKRILQWGSILAIVAFIFAQFGIEIGIIAGLLALAGGTIIGFAAMSTIGNAIAGIIVMTSRPFKIGDRILLNGKFADIVAIDLIYTRMKTLDNVLISVPNQELLTSEIDNYGKKTTIRRKCSITVDYQVDTTLVEKVLLEAATSVKEMLDAPKPYVWITDFGDFAMEYTLHVFINQIRRIPEIDATLKKAILEKCKFHGIDLSTPRLIQSVNSNSVE